MKILVVDDEPLARQRLLRLLSRVAPEAELCEASGGAQALDRVAAEQPEVLFLDIRMPEIDGVEVAARLLDLETAPAVIFCTAYDEYALEALQQHAIAYLLKPARERDVKRALQAAVRVNRAQLGALETRGGDDEEVVSAGHRGMDTLAVREVRCFLAEDKYVRACSPDGDLLLADALKDLEARFAGRFLRAHRNALVARAHIRALRRDSEGWYVELDGVAEHPRVSRRHLAETKASIAGK